MRVLLLSALFFASLAPSLGGTPRHWVTAYYGGWELGTGSNGHMPVSEVDFTAMTEVVHFALVPRPDGSLDSSGNSITSEGSRALIRAARKAGVTALISVGGWNSATGFEGATRPQTLERFVQNVVLFATGRGYGGIDIDWEPLGPQDYQSFSNLIRLLRAAVGPAYLLTAAVGAGSAQFMPSVQSYLDEINIMTYDLSFPSPGWITWHNAALHQNGVTFASTGAALPACDNIVASFVSAGVMREKIGIGIEFGGSVWKGGRTSGGNGVTAPGQSWITAPTMAADVPYRTIIEQYYTPGRYRWDPGAMASYLTIDSAGSTADCFVSYEDSSDIAAKIAYTRTEGLGGVILYELGMGYLGKGKSPLLEAVKKAAIAGSILNTPARAGLLPRGPQHRNR